MAKVHKIVIIVVLILLSCRNGFCEFCSGYNQCPANNPCNLKSDGHVFCGGCFAQCVDAICPPDCDYGSDGYRACMNAWADEHAASELVCLDACTYDDWQAECEACDSCSGGDPDPGNECDEQEITWCLEDPPDFYDYETCTCHNCWEITFISCEDIEIDFDDNQYSWNSEIWDYAYRYKVYFIGLVRTPGSWIDDVAYHKKFADGEYHYRGYLQMCNREGTQVPCAYLFLGDYKLTDYYDDDDCENTEPSGTFFFTVGEEEKGFCGMPDLDFTKWETAWTSLTERMPFSLFVFADQFFDMSSVDETPVTLSFPFFDDIQLVFADVAWLRNMIFIISVLSVASWLMRKIL
jgi:hypothetical protein